MNFVEELTWRGLIQDISDASAVAKLGKGDTFYIGTDPTAPSLQLGNIVPYIVAIWLARAGLKPLILFGGATGAIGDPKQTSERKLLDRETVNENVRRQSAQAQAIFSRAGVQAEYVNNYDWTHEVTLLDFLRDIGKHFTVNYMIAKDVVKARLEGDGISYTEFSYMLLQAFDFLHLYQNKNCKLQIGGSDQWGNITAGLELIRRKIQGEAQGFTLPLITDSQGKKFGKSEGNAVWLDAELTSPYKFHQFWLNTKDADVIRYLKVFTFKPRAEIEALEKALREKPEAREAQHALADAMTTFVHGEAATVVAKNSAQALFGGSLEGISEETLLDIFSDVPSSSVPREKALQAGIVDLLADSGLAKSRGEARRLVSGGGAYVNNFRIDDPEAKPLSNLSADKHLVVLRSGKKNYHLIKLSA